MMNQQTLWLSDRSDRRPVPWIQIAYSLLYASRPTCDWLGFPAIWLVNLDPATTRDCCRQNRTTHSCKIHVCRQTQVNNKGTCSKRDVHAVGSWRPSCVTNCDLVVQERVGRLVAGLSLLPHPVLGIGCRPTWNSCVRLFHSRANWRVFCFMLITSGTLCELWNAPSV